MYDLMVPRVQPPHDFCARDAAGAQPIGDGNEPGVAQRLSRLLDVVPYGMLLVHDDGQVLFSNQAARYELDESHPLQLMGRQIKVRRPQDVAPLREAIANAARRGLQRMVTLGDTDTETVTIAVAPAGDALPGHAADVMLVFGKRQICENLSADAFARCYHLTDAEARVLRQLCSGRKPTAIALQQGVAISTVRTQIIGIRQKTGARDINALVQQVAKLPPLMLALRAA